MSTQVANIDLSTATTGTAGKITWGQILRPLTIHEQMRPQQPHATLFVFNDSGCWLTCLFPTSHETFTIPAGGWKKVYPPPGEVELDYLVSAFAAGAPASRLFADYYAPGEPVDDLGILGNSPIGVTGTVSTSTSTNTFSANDTPVQAGLPIAGVTFGGAAAISGDTSAGSASFDGSSGYINGVNSNLPNGSGAFSLECWLKISANPVTNNRIVMFLGMPTAGAGGVFAVNTSGQVNGTIWGQASPPLSAALSLNVWHHVVLTFSGGANGSTLLYVDGTATGAAATNTPAIATNPVFTLASPNGSASNGFFPGAIAEAAIYGTALSAARVTAHYNAGTSSGYTSAVLSDNPLRYYRLNEPSGATYANSDIPSTITLAAADGSHSLGRLATVGGQPSAGVLGAPVIVAQVLNALVTATTLQNILTFTPLIDGLYRCSLFFTFSNTGATTITAGARFSDPNAGGPLANFVQGNTVLQAAAFSAGTLSVPTGAITIYAKAGSAITIQFTDSAGVPTDRVSAMIERLS